MKFFYIFFLISVSTSCAVKSKRTTASESASTWKLAANISGRAYSDHSVNEAYGTGVDIMCHLMMYEPECFKAIEQAKAQAKDFSATGVKLSIVLMGKNDFKYQPAHILSLNSIKPAAAIYYSDKNISDEIESLFNEATPIDLKIVNESVRLLNDIKGSYDCDGSILECKKKVLNELNRLH